MSSCVEQQLVASGRNSRTRSTLRNSTLTRRRSVAVRRHSAHVASDHATDQLSFDARARMSPAILRPIGRSPSQLVADNQTPTSCRPILRLTCRRDAQMPSPSRNPAGCEISITLSLAEKKHSAEAVDGWLCRLCDLIPLDSIEYVNNRQAVAAAA